MNVLLGIQARKSSKRLLDKMNHMLGGKRVIEHVVERCKAVSFKNEIVPKVVIVSPDGERIEVEGVDTIEGPLDDLVARYAVALNEYSSDALVRITGDCPFIDPKMIKRAVLGLLEADYVCNTSPRTYVDGQDVQACTKEAFYWVNQNQDIEREHPFYLLDNNCEFRMKFIREGFKIKPLLNPDKFIPNPYHPENKLSLDTEEDYKRLCGLVERIRS